MKSEETEMSMREKQTTIPTKWVKVAFGLMIGGVLYGPGRDGVARLLPQRGEADVKAAAVRADSDNAKILGHLDRIEALNSKLDALTAAVANLDKTDSELKQDVRDLNKRVDRIYYSPKP